MKNIVYLFGFVAVILLSGCENNNLSCEITSPKEGEILSVFDDIFVFVDAHDSKGKIDEVCVYLINYKANGIPVLFGSVSTEPYTVTIPSLYLALGKNTIKATVTDKKGNYSESFITVDLNEDFDETEESPDFVTFTDGKLPKGWKLYNWVIVNDFGYDDDNSIKTVFSGSSRAFISKTMGQNGFVEFWYSGWGVPTLYIDGQLATATYPWNDDPDWDKCVYNVDKGKHQLIIEMPEYYHRYCVDAIRFYEEE